MEVRLYLFFYVFIYLFTHSSTYKRLSTLPGSIFPTRRCEDEPFAILIIIIFSFFFWTISEYPFNRSFLVFKKKFVIKGKKNMRESVVHFSNGHHPFLLQSLSNANLIK